MQACRRHFREFGTISDTLPKCAIFKITGYSPGFLLEIVRLRTLENSHGIFTNKPQNSYKSTRKHVGDVSGSLGRFPALNNILPGFELIHWPPAGKPTVRKQRRGLVRTTFFRNWPCSLLMRMRTLWAGNSDIKPGASCADALSSSRKRWSLRDELRASAHEATEPGALWTPLFKQSRSLNSTSLKCVTIEVYFTLLLRSLRSNNARTTQFFIICCYAVLVIVRRTLWSFPLHGLHWSRAAGKWHGNLHRDPRSGIVSTVA